MCDEDSTFIARCMTDIDEEDMPIKLSDQNHISGCMYRAFAALKISEFKGTSLLSAAVITTFCRSYRYAIKIWASDPKMAAEAVRNIARHYFGDHSNCRKCETVNDDGTKKIWCGHHREGVDYKPNLPHGKWLQPEVAVGKGKKLRVLKLQAGVMRVLEKYAADDLIRGACHQTSSNPVESFNWTGVNMMGGKQTFHGQGGHYVGAMAAAVQRKSKGIAWKAAFMERLNTPLPEKIKQMLARREARAKKMKHYHKLKTTKARRLKRKHKKQKKQFKEQDQSYGKGVAMQGGYGIDGADGGGEEGGGEDEMESEGGGSDDESSDPEDDERCGGCGKATSTEDNQIIFCDNAECHECWHQCCLDPPLEKVPEGEWECPMCDYFKFLVAPSDA